MVKTTNLPGEFHFLWMHQIWAVLFSLVGANISATPPASLKIQVPVFLLTFASFDSFSTAGSPFMNPFGL